MTTSTRALTKAQGERVRGVLRTLAERAGSELAAARLVGISQQVWNRISKGDAPGLYVTKYLSKYTKIPLEYFLDGAPKNLERVLLASPLQWSASTVASAIKMAAEQKGGVDLPEEDWRLFLDEIERTLDPIVRRARSKLR